MHMNLVYILEKETQLLIHFYIYIVLSLLLLINPECKLTIGQSIIITIIDRAETLRLYLFIDFE